VILLLNTTKEHHANDSSMSAGFSGWKFFLKKWRSLLTAGNPQQKSGTVLICGYTIVVLD
jgi:hypothetical protein